MADGKKDESRKTSVITRILSTKVLHIMSMKKNTEKDKSGKKNQDLIIVKIKHEQEVT